MLSKIPSILCLLLGLLLIGCQSKSKAPETPAPVVEELKKEVPKTGVISGRMYYPGKEVPQDLSVVIRNLETGKMHATHQWNRKKMEYRLEVEAPARYEVFAITGQRNGYKAFFSEYVRCGMSQSCHSHLPVIIDLKPGESYSNANPVDWEIK